MKFNGLEIGDKVEWQIGQRQAQAKGLVYDTALNKESGFWGVKILCYELHGQSAKFFVDVKPKYLKKSIVD